MKKIKIKLLVLIMVTLFLIPLLIPEASAAPRRRSRPSQPSQGVNYYDIALEVVCLIVHIVVDIIASSNGMPYIYDPVHAPVSTRPIVIVCNR